MCISIDTSIFSFRRSSMKYMYIYVGNGFFRKRIGRPLFSFHLVVDDNIADVLLSSYINKMVGRKKRLDPSAARNVSKF